MKDFDIIGLHLAEDQANLFVESLHRYTGSSSIFIKRFMYSKEVANVDRDNVFDSAKILSELEKKSLSYGTTKYEEDIIYWIGYIYRYFAYVYEIPSKRIYQIVNADEMRKLYKAYHTMDPKFAIDRLLEAKNIKLDKSPEYQYQLYKRVIMQKDIEQEYRKSILKAKKEDRKKMKKYNPKDSF